FQIGWYNNQVTHKQFQFPFDPDTLAFVIISTPEMFEKGFKPFITDADCLGSRDPIDECMAAFFLKVKQAFPCHEIDAIHDFELHPNRRPKVLVQTAAHAAGAAYFYQRKDITDDPWPPTQRICGVCVHPKYGGWFAIRGVLIFKTFKYPDLPRKQPMDVVVGDEKRIELLEKFNFHWEDWSFRDVVPSERKYSDQQIKYFSTLPVNRKDLLDSILKE
ncbi:predicted protein, partial [Nematostella vectensis]